MFDRHLFVILVLTEAEVNLENLNYKSFIEVIIQFVIIHAIHLVFSHSSYWCDLRSIVDYPVLPSPEITKLFLFRIIV